MSRSILSRCLKLVLLVGLAIEITSCSRPLPNTRPEPTITPIPVTTTLGLAATPYIGEQTACDHAWFPLRLGAHWKYRLSVARCEGRCTDMGDTEHETSWQVTDVQGDEHLAEATILVRVADVSTFTLYALCDDAGVRLSENSGLDSEYYLDDEYYWLHPCDCTYALIHYDYSTAGCSGPTAGGLAACFPWSFLPSADSLALGHEWESGIPRGGASAGITYPSSRYTVIAVEPVAAADQECNGLTLAVNHSCSSALPCYNCWGYYKSYVETDSVLTSTIQLAHGVGITQMTTHINHTHASDIEGSQHANITWILELIGSDIPQSHRR
jgi:hypothetical protein